MTLSLDLGETAFKLAALLLPQQLQVFGGTLPVLEQHELGDGAEVADDLTAVGLKVIRHFLEARVPLLLLGANHLENALLRADFLEYELEGGGKVFTDGDALSLYISLHLFEIWRL